MKVSLLYEKIKFFLFRKSLNSSSYLQVFLTKGSHLSKSKRRTFEVAVSQSPKIDSGSSMHLMEYIILEYMVKSSSKGIANPSFVFVTLIPKSDVVQFLVGTSVIPSLAPVGSH